MNFLARAALLLIFVALPSLCLAQNNKRSGAATPPPPPPAIEYNPNSWKTFSADAGFSISLPGKPTYSSNEVQGTSGQLTQHNYILSTGTGNYVIVYSDFPISTNDPGLIQAALAEMRGALLSQSKDTMLLKEDEIKVEGYAGDELLIQEGDITQRWKVFIVENRVYQIVLAVNRYVAFNNGRPSANPADFTDLFRMMSSKYFDSFRLQ